MAIVSAQLWIGQMTTKLSERINTKITSRLEGKPQWLNYFTLRNELVLSGLPEFRYEQASGCICFRPQRPLTERQREIIQAIVWELIPWRKGPIQIEDLLIDTEWRSDLKWSRVEAVLKQNNQADILNQRVLDIGAGNSYYAWRMLEHGPREVVAIDPYEKFVLQADFLQVLMPEPRLQFKQLGIENIAELSAGRAFDTIFCMGVLYHRRDPINSLQLIRDHLKSDGVLYLETQIIPGAELVALCPLDRHAKAPNVYFLPTISCLQAWLNWLKFTAVEVLSIDQTSSVEQRQTPFSPGESLSDFLDANDPSKTVEGYPAPLRALVRAKKGI
ncbi:tRNA 5-methoxyuridine(34)/uridine 5-oxyacetic acid(34) synthase CmoB [bacterium]|nr:tRNA 5-methoxyuridine(34)/uridine 5-oxyacetic acid(34) synthase CmoB [bacterium]